MSKGLDKLITELKGKFGDKYDIDGMQSQIKKMHEAPMPPMPDEGIAVVEVEAVPEDECPVHGPECDGEECKDEPKSGEAEEPELPSETEGEGLEDTNNEVVSDGESETLEDATPAEEDRMQEILKAIKTFFPNENTEDVLVRLVQKLIDR